MGATSRPPSERGVNMRNNPVSYNASRTGRDRRRSRSASMSEVSALNCILFSLQMVVDAQCIPQPLRVYEVHWVKLLSEPVIYWREQIVGFLALVLRLPQASQADG